MKRIVSLILTALLLTGCNSLNEPEKDIPDTAVPAGLTSPDTTAAAVPEEDDGSYPVTVSGVTLYSAPERILSLSPAVTEMLCELGHIDKLCGRSDSCSYPEAVRELPSAGSSAVPDIDRIIELSPDAVLTQAPISKTDISILADNGIRVIKLDFPDSRKELHRLYYQTALITDGNNLAKSLSDTIMSEYNRVISLTDKSAGRVIFFLNDDLSAATGDTAAGEFISAFGENIAAEYTDCTVPIDFIREADPETIFLAADMDKEAFLKSFPDLDAVSEGRVFTVQRSSQFLAPTSRLLEAVKDVEEILKNYPLNARVSASM